MKIRLMDAATAIDRSGEYIRMEVKQTGIRMYMLRKGAPVMQTEAFTSWGAIERATQNPLLQVIRDLINQMDDQESAHGG